MTFDFQDLDDVLAEDIGRGEGEQVREQASDNDPPGVSDCCLFTWMIKMHERVNEATVDTVTELVPTDRVWRRKTRKEREKREGSADQRCLCVSMSNHL